jgi:hypothetical protein
LGVVETIISDFTVAVIEAFLEHSITVAQGLEKIMISFDFSSDEEETQIHKAVISQIRQLIVAEILLIP